jgi:JmjC domain, hydroxylase
VYGADQIGTLFKSEEGGSWNINKLDSIVNLLGPVPGVSSPYLYVGTWRSMFAYHVEDFNLYSINYLHAGASKSWYSIKQQDKKRFESLAVSYNVEEHQQCHEFLRHKTKMFSPNKLKEFGIGHSTVVHNAGEFVITFPGAYHAGFNHGLNVAESTNFATPRWFDIGSRAKRCICRPHSVNINVSRLETLYLRKEVKESRDVSHFHTNEDAGEESRRYRCVCATDGIFNVEEDSPPSKLCPLCSLWGHTACYDDEAEADSGTVTDAPFICFMCTAIESDLMEGSIMEPPACDSNHLMDIGSSPSSRPTVHRPLRAPRKNDEKVEGLRKIRKISRKNTSQVIMVGSLILSLKILFLNFSLPMSPDPDCNRRPCELRAI